jgi:hypothetical protein
METVSISRRSPYYRTLTDRKSATISKGVVLRKIAEEEDGSITATVGFSFASCVSYIGTMRKEASKALFDQVEKAVVLL